MSVCHKQIIINTLCINHTLNLMTADSSDEEEEIIENFNNSMISLLTHRRVAHLHVPKSTNWRSDVLERFDAGRVRHMLRVDEQEFDHIFNLIKDDKVFQNKNNVKQIPIKLQLQLTLFRLGNSGEAASIRKCASIYGLGDGGTVSIITKRVITAILNLKNKFLMWPDEEERRNIVRKTSLELPGCIGYIDGTELSLAEAPAKEHEFYFSRKRQYSIKMQVVCDYKLRIRQATIGVPGSVHDAKIFTSCPLARSPNQFFSNSQWIAGDSAYPLKTNLITPFRNNSSEFTKEIRDNFNEYFSKYRVRIENCFGQLKERFGSLKGLRFRLMNENNKRDCNNWITACCILHNILIYFNDPIEQNDHSNNIALTFPDNNIRQFLVNFVNDVN